MTSHDVVQRVRHRLGIRGAGHTGTLDPFATGLLVVLLGRATRLARFIERQPKRYLARARLGAQTTTDDHTGEIVAESDTWESIAEYQVRQTLAGFHGEQLQTPPLYSAKHVGGERSYRRARRGEPVQLEPVRVTIHNIDLVEYAPPDLSFRAVVSAGTYIRSLARDLGSGLGVGAHLIALRRESIGSLKVEDAVPLERLDHSAVLPPQAVLHDLPTVDLDEAAVRAVTHGRRVADSKQAQRPGHSAVALLADGRLVGIAEAGNGWLRPTVVLEPS